jgi:hypothetical protein
MPWTAGSDTGVLALVLGPQPSPVQIQKYSD